MLILRSLAVAFDFDRFRFLSDLCQIELILNSKQDFSVYAEGLLQPVCHFRAERGIAVNHVRQRGPSHVKQFGGGRYRNFERLQYPIPYDFARVRRVLHRAEPVSGSLRGRGHISMLLLYGMSDANYP